MPIRIPEWNGWGVASESSYETSLLSEAKTLGRNEETSEPFMKSLFKAPTKECRSAEKRLGLKETARPGGTRENQERNLKTKRYESGGTKSYETNVPSADSIKELVANGIVVTSLFHRFSPTLRSEISQTPTKSANTVETSEIHAKAPRGRLDTNEEMQFPPFRLLKRPPPPE